MSRTLVQLFEGDDDEQVKTPRVFTTYNIASLLWLTIHKSTAPRVERTMITQAYQFICHELQVSVRGVTKKFIKVIATIICFWMVTKQQRRHEGKASPKPLAITY